jgi:enolase
MKPIVQILAREILDSRGNPTLEVEMSDGIHTVRAAVPSGASTGIHEALELRDGDKKRYGGKGVLKAIENINTQIAPKIIGTDPRDQASIDHLMLELDGTENKLHLGANAILGVSLATARLGARQNKKPLYAHLQSQFGANSLSLPRPMMNILNGGSHADSGLAIQEFMVFPKLESFPRNLQAGAEIFHTLKKILSEKGFTTGVGDEGGFAPHIPTVQGAFSVIIEAIERAGYKPGTEIELAIDAAASEFYDKEKKSYTIDGEELTAGELTDFYAELVEKYPLVSIEDSHDEDDFEGFKMMQSRFGDRVQLVGDDLFVTNVKRLEMGIDQKLANAILIKVNQIGSLTETFQTIALAKAHGFGTIISHRSGETEDSFIADLSVGVDAGQIKTGSLSRSERIAKYNQLLRIGEEL